MLRWARGKTRLYIDQVRNVETGTHVSDGSIPQREEADMIWSCANAG